MKTNILTCLVLFSLCGCNQQDMSADMERVAEQETSLSFDSQAASSDSVQCYFDQARLGIGDAYVKMAQYYRDGTLGKPNLLNVMTMGFMAEEYMAIPDKDVLFKDVPDSDATKLTYHALDMLTQVEDEETLLAKANELLDKGIPEGHHSVRLQVW